MDSQNRIIVALDVDTRQEALQLVQELGGRVGLFKIGSQLFATEGPALVREIIARGEKVFLDLKFHDIPNTVLKAALAAQTLGVSMFTLHTLGGLKMMTAVADALKNSSHPQPPLVLGVTILTSMGREDLMGIGIEASVQDQVVRLAHLARNSGISGLVASPVEVPLLRQQLGNAMVIVTPGIRPAGSDINDQNRIATPAAAIKAGADFLVIGRPITAGHDRVGAVERIVGEMNDRREM
jgi:orotidine-5'-phosphate decarboxylase